MRTLTKTLLFMMMLALLMPTDAFAQKNRNKRRAKKVKTETVITTKSTVEQPTAAKAEATELSQNLKNEEKAIARMEELFTANINKDDLAASFATTKALMESDLTGKFSRVKNNVIKHYYDAFYRASDEEDLDKAVDCAFKYVMLGGNEDEDVMWRVLIENYAADADIKNAQFLLNKFVGISVSKNDAYQTTISELNQKYDDVFNPKTFEEAVKGTWVSVDKPFIISVNGLDVNTGMELLQSPITRWDAQRKKGVWTRKIDASTAVPRVSQSVYFNGDEKAMSSYFSEVKLKDPNTNLAKNLYAFSREFRATGLATSHSSDAPLGDQLKMDAISYTGSFVLDLLANYAAEGSKEVKSYGIEFTGKSTKLLDAKIHYNNMKVKTNNKIEKNIDQEVQSQFVKWEESDSVLFFSNNKPIFLGETLSDNSPMLKEYKEIKKKFTRNWWKPKYLLPGIGGIILGAGGAFAGGYLMWLSVEEPAKDAAEKQLNKELFSSGLSISFLSILGGIAMAKYFFHDKRMADCQKELDKLNERNREKLRNKAILTISPQVDAINSGLGVNAKLTF